MVPVYLITQDSTIQLRRSIRPSEALEAYKIVGLRVQRAQDKM